MFCVRPLKRLETQNKMRGERIWLVGMKYIQIPNVDALLPSISIHYRFDLTEEQKQEIKEVCVVVVCVRLLYGDI